ncbi:MAG: GreA/GreB family elongation factor [Candidatus Nomurabacteria bacterium]|nr:GreA/GreB family elongation factor [Candidatus Nomurabacteria bacterium]
MKHYFFAEDFTVLKNEIERIGKKIKELGKEQGEAASQSTENFGHDDACQEAIYDARRLLISRINDLMRIYNKSEVANPSLQTEKIRLGSIVKLSDGRVFRIGSYMILANHNTRNISYGSPLAKSLLGKKKGDSIYFNGVIIEIESIDK